MKGRNLSGLEVTPAMIHVRHATKIASEVTEGAPTLVYLSPLSNHTINTQTTDSFSFLCSFIIAIVFSSFLSFGVRAVRV